MTSLCTSGIEGSALFIDQASCYRKHNELALSRVQFS